MTVWPRFLVMAAATARATTSVALPGVKGTMMWIGLSGKFWAEAGRASSADASANAIRRFMDFSSLFSCRRYFAADAFYVQLRQNSFARRRQPGAQTCKIGPRQPTIALGEAAGNQHVTHAGARALHDHGGHRIVHRPHRERAERH